MQIEMPIEKQIDMHIDEHMQMQIERHIVMPCCMLCRRCRRRTAAHRGSAFGESVRTFGRCRGDSASGQCRVRFANIATSHHTHEHNHTTH